MSTTYGHYKSIGEAIRVRLRTMLINKYINILSIPPSQSNGLFSCVSRQILRYFYTKNKITPNTQPHVPDFGIVFDIDGVLMRGPKTIPAAISASDMLYEQNGKWKVPVLFLTNASNVTKDVKAAEISKVLFKRVNILYMYILKFHLGFSLAGCDSSFCTAAFLLVF